MFSMLCPFSAPINELEGLSQMIGLHLIDALAGSFDDKLSIKWPNDIYSDSGKVAGLLIECVKFDCDSCWLVIGINLSLIDVSNFSIKTLDYHISYLKEPIEKNGKNFLPSFVSKMDQTSHSFMTNSFVNYFEKYQKYDYFDLDQEVIVYDTEQSVYGYYKGLTQRGELLFECEGTIMTYHSGNVSIRAINDI